MKKQKNSKSTNLLNNKLMDIKKIFVKQFFLIKKNNSSVHFKKIKSEYTIRKNLNFHSKKKK